MKRNEALKEHKKQKRPERYYQSATWGFNKQSFDRWMHYRKPWYVRAWLFIKGVFCEKDN